MSDLDETFTDDSEGFKNLRKDRDKQAARAAELETRLAQLEAKESRGKLESALAAKGLNPTLADFYNSDDHSDEAVAAWTEKYKDVFVPAAKEPEPDSTVPVDVQTAIGQMGQLGTSGSAGTASVADQLDNAPSLEELIKVAASHGISISGL